ncbi:uncharacterized protein BXZ73DRAFT_82532 [Epithele typhae]|uniref:uncharacterized protein n=1 Tax=Epithele typhae TaxID=378194 RepID=UPI002007DCF4|nr:uncharacterized protein BXZ73DRAFT_82532 [Epithele typhae]KAH9912063.1 hypothetical protein BXZ73DRAFT_82532 [Epithele typhae]
MDHSPRPELGERSGQGLDSWSVGVIVLVMCVRAGDAIEGRVLIGLTQSTPFDADPQNVDIRTIVVTRGTLLYECDVSEQAERSIRALLASSQSERMSLTGALNHPWLAAEAEGRPRAVEPTLRRERGEPARQAGEKLAAPSQDMRAWAAEASGEVGGGPVEEQVEEPEPRATKGATPTRGNKTLEGDKRVGRSSTRKGAKRKSLGEESDDEGYGDAASMPLQTQEQEDSEGEWRVAKRPRTERLEISVAEVEGTD